MEFSVIMAMVNSSLFLYLGVYPMVRKLELAKQEVNRLRKDHQDCFEILEDFERAKKAGVPNMDIMIDKLKGCAERIEKLLAFNNEANP